MFTLSEVVHTFRHRFFWIIVIMCLSAGGAFAFVRFTDKSYESSIQFELVSNPWELDQAEENRVYAILQSNQFMEAFALKASVVKQFNDDFNRDSSTLKYRVTQLKRATNIDYNEITGQYDLTIDWRIKESGLSLLREMMGFSDEYLRERKIHQLESEVGRLEREVSTQAGLVARKAIIQLAQDHVKEVAAARAAENFVIRVLDSPSPGAVFPQMRRTVVIGLTFGVWVVLVLILIFPAPYNRAKNEA